MKHPYHSSLAALAISCLSCPAAEQIVTLGDSLTFAYEAEFGFQYTVPLLGTTYGDGFGPDVRNWIEILNDPAYRNQHFDIGVRDTYTIPGIPYVSSDETFLFRHEYNWAIPGQTVSQMRRFITGTAGFIDLLAENPDFESLVTAIEFTDFDASQYALIDFEKQIQDTAERLTFFIGGNDVRGIYGTVYNGGTAGTFVDEFMADSIAVLDRVQELNPDIQVVIVNVPHIGITPEIKGKYPTEPVKTARVTAVLDELNARLSELAAERGFGYADIYSRTLSLLGPADLCIHGIGFENTGSSTGELDKVWLNGPLSANFHPNTNAHAIIANAVIEAFNDAYDTGIAPLTASEILGGLHSKTPTEIDMPFAEWMTCFGLGGLSENDDSDQDGITAGVEFGLGLDPTLQDSHKLQFTLVEQPDNSRAIELAYPVRLPSSTQVSVRPATSTDLSGFTPSATVPTIDPDGLSRAVLPVTPGEQGFIRIQSDF
ncbi:SGNH/GDSL hydrolase family protein [Haloferula chungangensis]|uniref:SGNH/GDSL hydrolase family protein n=1 Tax=Haloferula chungangensis TaxID=1048331 RepID=A0ABW2L2K2_9BACT